MRELSCADALVFFLIVAWSLLCEIALLDIAHFVLDILCHCPQVILRVLVETVWSNRAGTIHYRRIANPLQRIVVSLLGYAFDRVHHRIGRLFLSSQNCLRFLRWRIGHDMPFTRFVLSATKEYAPVEVYQFSGDAVKDSIKQVILYVHGGGLIVGSVPFYAEFLIELAGRCTDTIILSPEYDLVPEACFPTQLQQIMAVYKHIRLEWSDAKIVVGGDSAGAGLCQSLLCALTAESRQYIDRAFYISPWLDFSAETQRTAGCGDYITPEAARRYGRWYDPEQFAGTVARERLSALRASPLAYTADELRRSCPSGGILVMAGGSECLLSDAQRLNDKVGDTKKVNLHVQPHEIHAYALTNLYLRRGNARFAGLDKIISFLADARAQV